MAKKPERATFEEATTEVAELWAAYRAARDANSSAAVFDGLKAKVRGARARAKKRIAEESGFSTLAQQLADLGEYIKRYKPRDESEGPPATPEQLLAEVASIEKSLHDPKTPSRVRRVLEQIERARMGDRDADHDHDVYVDIEEQLGILGFATTLDEE